MQQERNFKKFAEMLLQTYWLAKKIHDNTEQDDVLHEMCHDYTKMLLGSHLLEETASVYMTLVTEDLSE